VTVSLKSSSVSLDFEGGRRGRRGRRRKRGREGERENEKEEGEKENEKKRRRREEREGIQRGFGAILLQTTLKQY
jgi:hypothetical protein